MTNNLLMFALNTPLLLLHVDVCIKLFLMSLGNRTFHMMNVSRRDLISDTLRKKLGHLMMYSYEKLFHYS